METKTIYQKIETLGTVKNSFMEVGDEDFDDMDDKLNNSGDQGQQTEDNRGNSGDNEDNEIQQQLQKHNLQIAKNLIGGEFNHGDNGTKQKPPLKANFKKQIYLVNKSHSQNIEIDDAIEEDEEIEEEGQIVDKYTRCDSSHNLRKPTFDQIRTFNKRNTSLNQSHDSFTKENDKPEFSKQGKRQQFNESKQETNSNSFHELKQAQSMYHNRRQSKIQEFEQDVKISIQTDFLDKCNWEFVEQVEKYTFEISKYKFIGDTIDQMHVMSFGHSTMSLINYFLSKKMVIMIRQQLNPLSQKQNEYKLESWDQFVESKSYKMVLTYLQNDLAEWVSKMQFFLGGINKKEITSEKILKLLTEDVSDQHFDKGLQNSYIQIFKIVIRSSVQMGINQKDEIRQEEIFKSLYRIVICLFLNEMLEPNQLQINFGKYLEFAETEKMDLADFNDWIEDLEKTAVFEEIKSLIKKYCGKKFYESLNIDNS